MQYQVRVAGKVFQSADLKALLKRAVEAKQTQLNDRLISTDTAKPGVDDCVPIRPVQLVTYP